MASILINVGSAIAAIAISLGEIGKNTAPKESVIVQIGIRGKGDTISRSVPHIALWDEKGNRIWQYHSDANGHLDDNYLAHLTIENKQAGGKSKQPEYVMLTMNERDAICIAMISAGGNGAQWTWLGNMGKACGADWCPSNFKIGDSTITPPCVLDRSEPQQWDQSPGTKFAHARLFSCGWPNSAILGSARYACKSTARMTFWYDIVADAVIPNFQPPLKYAENGADLDLIVSPCKEKDCERSGFKA